MTTEQKTSDAVDTSDLDPRSLAAIRDLLATEPQAKPQPVEERVAEQAAAQIASAEVAEPKQRKQAKTPRPTEQSPDGSLLDRLKARVTGYRPSPKHIAIAAFVLLLVFRPWLVFGVFFLIAFVITGIFLILGYDGFWHRVMGLARWYARRRPSRSAEIHSKLDGFAMKFDGFLDRFPEGSVDGLYLPDFGDLAEAEARHDEALDRRFDGMRETGA